MRKRWLGYEILGLAVVNFRVGDARTDHLRLVPPFVDSSGGELHGIFVQKVWRLLGLGNAQNCDYSLYNAYRCGFV